MTPFTLSSLVGISGHSSLIKLVTIASLAALASATFQSTDQAIPLAFQQIGSHVGCMRECVAEFAPRCSDTQIDCICTYFKTSSPLDLLTCAQASCSGSITTASTVSPTTTSLSSPSPHSDFNNPSPRDYIGLALIFKGLQFECRKYGHFLPQIDLRTRRQDLKEEKVKEANLSPRDSKESKEKIANPDFNGEEDKMESTSAQAAPGDLLDINALWTESPTPKMHNQFIPSQTTDEEAEYGARSADDMTYDTKAQTTTLEVDAETGLRIRTSNSTSGGGGTVLDIESSARSVDVPLTRRKAGVVVVVFTAAAILTWLPIF